MEILDWLILKRENTSSSPDGQLPGLNWLKITELHDLEYFAPVFIEIMTCAPTVMLVTNKNLAELWKWNESNEDVSKKLHSRLCQIFFLIWKFLKFYFDVHCGISLIKVSLEILAEPWHSVTLPTISYHHAGWIPRLCLTVLLSYCLTVLLSYCLTDTNMCCCSISIPMPLQI